MELNREVLNKVEYSSSRRPAQLFGQGKGALGLAAVGEEAAGLPAHPPLQRRQVPMGEGSLQRVAVDARLAGRLPQPHFGR